MSDSARRIIRLNRRLILLKNLDPYKAARASALVTAKQVSRYDEKGKRLATYPSTMEAARQTGLSVSHIGNAVRGRERTAGGSFWFFGSAAQIDIASFLAKWREGYVETGTKITQYDLNGCRIAQYSSIKEAAVALGVHYTGISANLRGITATAYGYRWRKGWGKARIKV
ncbi:MAG TPA: NUMOD1 domain-containing DNA-binding protein [Flavitalea sp.]|nr:NUMOD1 domain-containing DNA-binding protein [Flavitalea sp.]